MICAALALFIAGTAHAATGIGEELLQSCQTLLRSLEFTGHGDEIRVRRAPDAQQCWGLISAFYQLNTVGEILFSCPARGTTMTQMIRAYVRYATTHVSDLNKPAAIVAMNAFSITFPCK
jgi:hypothetical protein